MWMGPTKYYQAAKSVQQALDAALTNQVDRSGVVPGAIAWDDCSCGMLAVSIGRVYLSDSFPMEQDNRVGNCDSAWEVIELIIQIIRCAPQPEDGQVSPDEDEMDNAAQVMAADAQQIVAALSVWGCAHRNVDVVDTILLGVEPQGPDGACVGSEFRFRIGFPRSY
jgi:hypothetical protein